MAAGSGVQRGSRLHVAAHAWNKWCKDRDGRLLRFKMFLCGFQQQLGICAQPAHAVNLGRPPAPSAPAQELHQHFIQKHLRVRARTRMRPAQAPIKQPSLLCHARLQIEFCCSSQGQAPQALFLLLHCSAVSLTWPAGFLAMKPVAMMTLGVPLSPNQASSFLLDICRGPGDN